MFQINSNHFVYGTLALLLALSLAGCSKQEEKPTTGQAPQSAAPPSGPTNVSTPPPTTSAPSAPAIATADGESQGTRVEVNELKRTGDNTVTLKFTIVNDADKDVGFGYDFGDQANQIKDFDSVGGVNLIDSAGKKKYFVIRDTESNCVCSRGLKSIRPRTRGNLWAKFPAPPDEVQKISVVIPHFGPLDDVPISR